MKVIWSYRERFKGKGSEFTLSGLQLFLGIASVISVQKFLPEATRVIYVDKRTFEFLEKNKIIELWDEVILVDFDKVLENYASFFAYPKIWALTQQDSPFLLLDLDYILLKNPLDGLDLTKNYGIHNKDYPDVLPEKDPARTYVSEAIGWWKQKQLPEPVQAFVDFEHYYLGVNTYWGDPKIANSIGNKMFEIGLEIEQIDKPIQFKWFYYEEAIFYQVSKFFGSELRPMPGTGIGYHMPNLGAISDIPYLEDYIYSVLRVDVRSMYPKLDFHRRCWREPGNKPGKTIL